ncbi:MULTISPECIES: metal ABC transporter ATP-binding protein [Terrabacteria group]|uniref:metal ABC transporter ATP-binding protein n=1 Tax=Bacillati TaxID=1783272 RepID=UPI00193ABB83|nr:MULTISPECIES: metal ABC transporter ATP-binding protein [Terrabacteria group]MBW9212655.1 metal ABC transporter ATP-binding protein [Trueperella sp. zg.1013]QRG86858.1 metal ABC transporter ATP-binding protein [Bulleidia sp. zg-1006]
MSVIHVEDLTVSYGYQPVLWDIDVDIEEASLTAIVGPNGAGKSTLLKAILGFVKSLSGVVTLYDLPLKDVLNRLAYVPQQASVNWDFPITVFDVVLMGRYSSLGWFHRPNKEEKKLAMDALEEMKISDLKDRQISELSGGQKQRVFIARALCQNAQLILMDEPLAGVDKTSEKIIMDKMKALQKEGRTIVCVHHDLQTLRDYFDHVVLINRNIIAYGPIKDILTQENLDITFQEGPVC